MGRTEGRAARSSTTTAAPPQQALAHDLAAAVERMRRVAMRMWDRIEGDLAITVLHADALRAIAGGSRQVSAVAGHCGRHVSSASRLVDQLVSNGFVDRVEDPDDRRAVRLTLTARGRDVVERIEAAQADLLAHGLAQLGDDGPTFVALIERFADAAETVVDRGRGAASA